MDKIKTDEALLARLKESATRPFNDGEAEAQRVSFIYSGLPDGIAISKAEIRELLRCA
ncbi:MAG: hypothetical protein AAF926_04550 [Pseudomonadota bacterium]